MRFDFDNFFDRFIQVSVAILIMLAILLLGAFIYAAATTGFVLRDRETIQRDCR